MRSFIVLFILCACLFSCVCMAEICADGFFAGKYEYDADMENDGEFSIATSELSASLTHQYRGVDLIACLKVAIKERDIVASKYYVGIAVKREIPIEIRLGRIGTPFSLLMPGNSDILTIDYPKVADLQDVYMNGLSVQTILGVWDFRSAILEREEGGEPEKQFQSLIGYAFGFGFVEMYGGTRFDGLKNSYGMDLEIMLPVGTLIKGAYIAVDEASGVGEDMVFKSGYYFLLAHPIRNWLVLAQYDYYDEENFTDQQNLLAGLNYYFADDSACIKMNYEWDPEDSDNWTVSTAFTYKFKM